MTKALRLEETCPKCGSHLMIHEGEYGDFLACPKYPTCKFTKPRPDSDLPICQTPSPYCEKCNHTGLLPFKNKESRAVPYTYSFCECNPLSNGNSYPYPYQYTPEMFDFPMSYDFYRSLCSKHGWQDPGSNYPQVLEQQPQVIEHIHFHSSLSKKEWDEMEQTRLRTLHLQGKLKELQDKKVDKQDRYTKYK